MAASVLHALGQGERIVERLSPAVGTQAARIVQQMLTGLHRPATSSAAAGLMLRRGAGPELRQSHEAEAAIAMEQRATRWLTGGCRSAAPERLRGGDDGVLDLRALVAPLFDVPCEAVDEAGRFHAALADSLAEWAAAAARRRAVGTICLGGGCFHNALLSAGVVGGLQARGLRVLRRRPIPAATPGWRWGRPGSRHGSCIRMRR